MFKEEFLQSWNMTEEECEKAIRKITLPHMRLTFDEKTHLFFLIQEGMAEADDVEELSNQIKFLREVDKEIEEDNKLIKRFAKEVRRLEEKYECLNPDIAEKTLDELTSMWINDYFELYFMDDHFDSIVDAGPEKYAQYYLHVRGVIPESEVTMWA